MSIACGWPSRVSSPGIQAAGLVDRGLGGLLGEAVTTVKAARTAVLRRNSSSYMVTLGSGRVSAGRYAISALGTVWRRASVSRDGPDGRNAGDASAHRLCGEGSGSRRAPINSWVSTVAPLVFRKAAQNVKQHRVLRVGNSVEAIARYAVWRCTPCLRKSSQMDNPSTIAPRRIRATVALVTHLGPLASHLWMSNGVNGVEPTQTVHTLAGCTRGPIRPSQLGQVKQPQPGSGPAA